MSEPPDLSGIAYELLQRAKEGDEVAANELVFIGRVFASSVAELFYHSEEGRKLILDIAANELTWPCIASQHGRMQGHPDAIAEYLKELNLGSAHNINKNKHDPRTIDRLEGCMFFYNVIRKRGVVTLSRGRIRKRDDWMKSSFGTEVKKEVNTILSDYFEFNGKAHWMEEGLPEDERLLKGVVDEAKRAALLEVNSDGRSSDSKEIEPPISVIRTKLVNEITRQIFALLE